MKELTNEQKKLITAKTGIRPGVKGMCACPVCHIGMLYFEISAFTGVIKAYCDQIGCVKLEE